MGISMHGEEGPGAGFPATLVVRFECDEVGDIFCRGFADYSHQDGYIGVHAAAMADGWLERQAPDGRKWICPRCSGK